MDTETFPDGVFAVVDFALLIAYAVLTLLCAYSVYLLSSTDRVAAGALALLTVLLGVYTWQNATELKDAVS